MSAKISRLAAFFAGGAAGALAGAPHPMSCADILAFRRPQLVSLSPDGRHIAYTVRDAHVDENRNVDTIYILDAAGGAPLAGPGCEKVQQFVWDAAGRLFFLGGREPKIGIWQLDPDGRTREVAAVDSPIKIFAVAPDARHFYFTTTRMTAADELQRRKDDGFVYNWETQTSRTIINRDYSEAEWEDVWEAGVSGKTPRRLDAIRYDGVLGVSLMRSLVVSPSGRYLTMAVTRRGHPEKGGTPYRVDLLIRDLTTGEMLNPFPESVESEMAPCWIGEQEIAFLCGYPLARVWLYDVAARQARQLDWVKLAEREQLTALAWDAAHRQLQAFGTRLYRISLAAKTTSGPEPVRVAFAQTPAIDAHATRMAMVSESITEPPEIAIYDLAEKTTARLTTLNPQLKALALGAVERLRVEASPGVAVSGFLLHPVDEEAGKKYPLIIATYGFTGKFITDAEWHSSFPAQTLAGMGYAVLLLNIPGTAQNLAGDAVKARQIEGWNKIAVFEKALDLMIERGLADPAKVGLYGWSMGAFTVEFLVAHSKRFHVVCLGEGGDYNPGMFWAYGNKLQTRIFDNIFGGPPWGATRKNYDEFSAACQVGRIDTPMLMEFVGGLPFGLEMFVPLRYRGVPAELVLYEGEEHNFVKPRARLAAMARKVDWFNFWLLGKEDPDPKKAGQYERWRNLREPRGG